MSDETDDVGYESGPFCRHWADACDCDAICAKCGVECRVHDQGDCEWEEME